MAPTVKQVADKWSRTLTPNQRELARQLAERLRERNAFGTEMIPDFQAIGLRSMNLEFILRIGQWSKEGQDKLVQDTLSVLEKAGSET